MLKDKVEELQDEIELIGNQSIKSLTNRTISRKISKLASMRTKDIEDLGFEKSQYQDLVNKYNTYKSLLTEIKAKAFEYVNFEYDTYTGRVTKMYYKL